MLDESLSMLRDHRASICEHVSIDQVMMDQPDPRIEQQRALDLAHPAEFALTLERDKQPLRDCGMQHQERAAHLGRKHRRLDHQARVEGLELGEHLQMRPQRGPEPQSLFEHLPELDLKPPPKLVDHRDHQIIALGKMHEHIAMRHANRFRDIGSRSSSDPLARKQPHRRVDQPSPRRDLLFLPSNRLHRCLLMSKYSVSMNSPYDRAVDVSSAKYLARYFTGEDVGRLSGRQVSGLPTQRRPQFSV